MRTSRREFIELAADLGATLAWTASAKASQSRWREARELFPQGVASGDPDPTSVILWTRRPFGTEGPQVLDLEVTEDPHFRRVVGRAAAPVAAESDWTARVLMAGLKPSRFYWYRFTDKQGERQPYRAHPHRAGAGRRAAGQFRLRQLSGRQRRHAKRLPQNDLRRRARGA